MVLNKIKNIKRTRGFTIVELLIVIVVIGILAAITIVAYSGITARANTTKAQTNAAAVQKVAEAYNADGGSYPGTLAAFLAGYGTAPSSKLPSGITMVGGLAGSGAAPTGTQALTSANGLTSVSYSCLASCTAPAGGRISYWDYTTGAPSLTIIYVGSATATSPAYITAA